MLLIVLIALGVCSGFRTRMLAIAGILALLLLSHVYLASTLVVLHMTNSIALALIGPGAFSADAWRFGRRTIILPPSQRD